MRIGIKAPFFILSLFFTQLTLADAIGVGAGIHGVHIDYQKAFSEKLSARFMLTDMPFTYEIEEDDIKYEAEYDRTQVSVLLDYFPFSGAFHISGGIFFGGHDWNLDAEANDGEYDIGDRIYTSDNLNLTSNVGFAQAEPYFGIGWGNNIGDSGIVVNIDLGVLYIGSASVSYKASGTVSFEGGPDIDVGSSPEFQEDLEKERIALEDALDDYQLLPILQLGIAYRF